MAKNLLSFLFVVVLFSTAAFSQKIQTSYQVLVEGNPNGASLSVDEKGQILISGGVNLYNDLFFRHLLLIDSLGNVVNDFPQLEINGPISYSEFFPGGIFIRGQFTEVNGQVRNGYAKLDREGNLIDPFQTFPDLNIEGSLVQEDGKIIMIGFFSPFEAEGYLRMIRFNQDGSLDDTFENNLDNSGFVSKIRKDHDGNLFVSAGPILYKFDPNGGIFPNFTFETLQFEYGGSILFELATNGKIYISTSAIKYGENEIYSLFRINPDGRYDESFNIPLQRQFNTAINNILPLSNGQLIILSVGVSENFDFLLFEEDGTEFRPLLNDRLGSVIMVESINGDVFFSGNIFLNEADAYNFGKLDRQNLTVDKDFSNSLFQPSWGNEFGGALDVEGNLFAGGSMNKRINQGRNLLKINPMGVIEETFSSEVGRNEIFSISIDSESQIYVAKQRFVPNNFAAFPFSKLDIEGKLLSEYSPNNTTNTFDNYVVHLEASDTMVLFGGSFSSFGGAPANALAGLSPDGQLIWKSDLPQGSFISKFRRDQQGAVYVAGNFFIDGQSYTFLKINPDGSIAENFRLENTFPFDFTIDQDGHLILVGFPNFYPLLPGNALIRLDPEGNINEDFPSFNLEIGQVFNAVLKTKDGNLLVGGSFQIIDGETIFKNLMQLNSKGEIIKDFKEIKRGSIRDFVYDGGNVFAIGLAIGDGYASNVTKILMPVNGEINTADISGDEFGQINLTWEANTKAAEYILIYKEQAVGAGFSVVDTLDLTSSSWSDLVNTDATTFRYLISYSNDAGQGLFSDTLSFTTSIIIPTLGAPQEISQFSFLATWRAIPNTDEYILELSEQLQGDFTADITLGEITGSSVRVEGLKSNTAYRYRLKRRVGEQTSAYSNEVQVSTLIEVPEVPTNFVATSVVKGVELSWQDNSDREEGFILSRIEVLTGDTITWELDANTTTYLDNSALVDVQYQYRLFAFNDGGNSEVVSAELQFILSSEDSDQLVIYPNPTVSRIQVRRDGQTLRGGISIYNAQGRLIRKMDQIPVEGIDISELPRGLYILRLDAEKFYGRFIKE